MCLTSTEGPNVDMMLLIITQCPDSSKSGMPSGVETVIPWRTGKRECFWANLQYEREDTGVRLIEEILSDSNISEAIRRVKSNKGAAGIDRMTVDEIDAYFGEYGKEISVEPYFLPSFMQTETADYFNRNNKRYWHFCFPEEQIMPIPVFISLNVMYDLNVKSIRKGKDSRTHKSLTAHPGTPTMHMLQDSLLHFKNYVKKYPGKDILSMTLEDCMEIIMDHSLSENTGRFHTYLTESGKKKCRSRSLAVSGGYSRTLITFENGERKEERVDISVYRCRTCGHYHAVLPYHVIIPYVSYSVQFILSLFIDRKVRKMTVSALLRKYGLSRTTYYRLLKKLAPYYVIHRMTRDSYGMSLFVQAQADGRRLLDSVFTASCMALMEGSRTLHKQRPTSGTSPSLPE